MAALRALLIAAAVPASLGFIATPAVEYLKMPSPEEALAVPAPVIGSARADELIKWLWETAQFRPDYPACSIDYFAEDVVYEDMVYKDPFIGKPAVSTMLAEVKAMAPEDFIFVVDRCSDGARACGFTWHIELGTRPEAGKFANGMSFYELDEAGRICYVRDLVEPSIKTGSLGIRLASVIGKAIGKAPPREQ